MLTYLMQAFQEAYAAGDLDAAYCFVVAGLKWDAVDAWRSVVNGCSYAFSKVVGDLGREAEIAGLLDALYQTYPDMICITPPTEDPLIMEKTKDLWSKNIEKGLPYYLFAPQAKSGSTFLGNIIPQGFGMPCVTYSAINVCVVPSWARAYRRGGAAYVTHLLPTADNVRVLADSGLAKVVVNTRDPRQMFLSYLHDMLRYRQDYPELARTGYFSLPLDQQAVAQLQLFTDFYGGDLRHFDRTAADASNEAVDYHFRKGEIDEWRRVFGAELVEKLNALIPAGWYDRFGWQP
jgi:hypothetical protein